MAETAQEPGLSVSRLQSLAVCSFDPLLTQMCMPFSKLAQLHAGLDQCLGLTPHLTGEQPFVL